MNGKELAQQVIERYGTSDAFALVERAGISLSYGRWHPVTLGEYDKKTRSICINLNAAIDKELIIAHELGHYFAADLPGQRSRAEEEQIAEDFAAELKAQRPSP
ncbi:hypothetical protein GCM10023189_12770 [Nibrella saemangeumensis]|uniref:IrrE N-terminal-like domain-containing protein n=1 Tax=Nibrella saemangeumensis TaxID=1084526 RepID=A0ABP8MJW5_9BACT